MREQLGESQTVFGERFPVDRRTIQRWELGDASPSPMAIARMRELGKSREPEPEPRSESASVTTPRRRGVQPSSD